jgi:RimJ/RimL family protein N-acetyltransferase
MFADVGLEGEGVRLTPLRPEDSARLFEWINDRDLVSLNAPFEPVDEAGHRRWFEQVQEREDVEIFAIRLRDDDRLVGSCQLRGLAPGKPDCELQIRIGDRSAWDRGHGTEAVGLLVCHAFDDLGLTSVSLDVFATNPRAIRAYEKAGFARRSVREGGAVIEGEPVDVVEMEITAGARDPDA